MQEFTYVTGIILKQTPIGEYDRRVCLLTKEKLPEIITTDGISPPCRAVIGQLILEYSKSLSAL